MRIKRDYSLLNKELVKKYPYAKKYKGKNITMKRLSKIIKESKK